MTHDELKIARHTLGLTAERFAKIFGAADARQVYAWESGSRNGKPAHIPPSVATLVNLALSDAKTRKKLGIM